jgi:hypothetical protein
VNKFQTADFIQALNALQPYVPPLLFAGIAHSEVTRTLVAIANNQLICDLKPIATVAGNTEPQSA